MEKRAKLSLSAFLHYTMQWSPAFDCIGLSYCKVSLRTAIIQFHKCRFQETMFSRQWLLTVEGKFFHYQVNAGKLPLQINSSRKIYR